MGFHVLGLSYASLPIAVSQLDLWCVRPGADATACNAQMHEAVLFGRAPGDEGGGDQTGGLWPVAPSESVGALAAAALRKLGWWQFLRADGGVAWERVVVSGHSQGASHAAYLSVAVRVRAAVLFSGPQEGTENGKGWIGEAAASPPTLRRAAFARKEECGDEPHHSVRASYCATRYPGLQRKNLGAMGLVPGVLGNVSGFVVLDFTPRALGVGRSHHEMVALGAQAPAAVVAIWKTLFAGL